MRASSSHSLLGLHQHQREVRAGRQVRGRRADHEAVVALAGHGHAPLDHGERVLSDQVELGVQLQREDAVRQLHQRAGGVARQVPILRAPAGRRRRSIRAAAGPRRRRPRRGRPGPRGPRRAAPGGLVRAELPREAPSHGAVDGRRRVGDLRADPGGVVQAGRDQAAQELAGPVLGRRPAARGGRRGPPRRAPAPPRRTPRAAAAGTPRSRGRRRGSRRPRGGRSPRRSSRPARPPR